MKVWRTKSGDTDPLDARSKELTEEIRRLEREIRELSRKPAQPDRSKASVPPSSPRVSRKAEPAPLPPPPPPAVVGSVDHVIDARVNPHGVRKFDLAGLWRRIHHHFRGPSANNPRMVQYLAAGSVHGLRPLRYEKRVARNRFVGLFVLLVLILFGLARVYFPSS